MALKFAGQAGLEPAIKLAKSTASE
jgi:hypothetical protein